MVVIIYMNTFDFLSGGQTETPVTFNSTLGSETTEDESTDHLTLPGQTILNTETPTEGRWAFIPLYITNQLGKDRYWQIGYDDTTNELVTIWAEVKGKQKETPNRREVKAKGKNTNLEQALLEARAEYLKKYREGYHPAFEINDAIQLQLANKYNPPGSVNPSTNKALPINIKEFPVLVFAKLDGNRAQIELTNQNKVVIKSRHKIEFHHLEHIRENIAKFFYYLEPGTIIDAELYIHNCAFEDLSSALHTRLDKHPNNDKFKAYIIDLVEPVSSPVEYRFYKLLKAFHTYLSDGNVNTAFEIVTPIVARCHQDLDEIQTFFVTHYKLEGLMIRKPLGTARDTKHYNESIYKGKRNNNLLKFKKWETDEGIVVDVDSAEGNERGLAMITVEYEGRRIRFKPAVSFEQRKYWYDNPSLILGLPYTIKFFNKSKKGVPKMITGVGLRVNG